MARMSRGMSTLAMAGAVVAAGLLLLALRRPSADRNWAEDMRILARPAPPTPGEVRMRDVRNWRYGAGTVLSRDRLDGAWDPGEIQEIWLYEQEFDRRGRFAHTFVVFEFPETYGDRRFLGLSMEARREEGETYSILRGAFRGFEAIHIWATEEDLVTRRVVYAGDPVIRYRLVVSPEARSSIFLRMVEETRLLLDNPRWYNTVTYNCTSSLIRYANESEPGAIPLHYSWVLTGRIDEYLTRLGYLDASSTRTITPEVLLREGLRVVDGD